MTTNQIRKANSDVKNKLSHAEFDAENAKADIEKAIKCVKIDNTNNSCILKKIVKKMIQEVLSPLSG